MSVTVLLLNIKEGAFQGTSRRVILSCARAESRFDWFIV